MSRLLLTLGAAVLGTTEFTVRVLTYEELAKANSKGHAIEVINTPACQFWWNDGHSQATYCPYTSSGDPSSAVFSNRL